ncbi:DUF1835 domain-containing protein [Paenibacillus gansuensis]|uniref:DUF1835 domain-containing protein n=1 Tax=Paenibacillus gansuensis TaxID=306542 RepID=A0ABW5PI88_9BACL
MNNLDILLRQLSDRDARLLLHNLVQTSHRYATEGTSEEQKFAEHLLKLLFDQAQSIHNERTKAEALQTHVHLVFSLSDAGSLKVALSKVGKRSSCQVLAFNELFSVGPITDLDTSAGQRNRLLWLMEHDGEYRYGNHTTREHQLENLCEALKRIPENKTIVIWCADNAHDQTGLRFALHLLREREQPVHVVNVTEVAAAMGFRSKNGLIPYAIGLLKKEHYEEILRLHYEGIPLEPAMRKQLESEWLSLAKQDHVFRVWQNGKVTGSEASELDEVIANSVRELQEDQHDGGYVKAGSVILKVFENSRQLVGTFFIIYRIWVLVDEGVLAFRGFPSAPHQFSVRLVGQE